MSIDRSRRTPSNVALRRRARLAILVALGLAVGVACDSPPDEVLPAEQAEYEGLSRDQLQNQAEPMTPEEAARLGIVDTTLGIGPPMSPDSIVLPEGVVPAAPVAPPDTSTQ